MSDAQGHERFVRQRDLWPRRDFKPEVWVRHVDKQGGQSRVKHVLWRFDCRASTAQRVAEGVYRPSGEVVAQSFFDDAPLAVARDSVDAPVLWEICRSTGRPETPPHS